MLARIPRWENKNVLVGFETADDAGVYRLTPDMALVQTVDFFTPIVDDAYTFGAIAAANSLSDVYAMGGQPITSLSILCYPGKGDLDALESILRGGAEKMREADCALLGGHSVNDAEIKFGYSVTGLVHPARVKTNAGAQPGDALVLTKRLGTGVIATALKRGIASDADVEASTESMLTLNRAACEAMLELDVHGCTDITGFGLIGHAREMALASGATVEIDSRLIRYLPGAVEYAKRGAIPGGLNNNRAFAAGCVEGGSEFEDLLTNSRKTDSLPAAFALLYDPQTSGGLLIALPESDAARLERTFPAAYRIGRVTEPSTKPIRIL